MTADFSIKDEYVKRFPILTKTAELLSAYLLGIVTDIPRIDAVTTRAKDPDRYFAKAVKPNSNGGARYENPKYGIQDQIGARINVLYLSDVEIVRNRMTEFMKFIEESPKSPDDDSAFGYFGYHFIFQTPDEIISDSDRDDVPEFFELQIKTLFQHAWSESNHDLSYKTHRNLNSDERRMFAFTAAQAWGADQIFEDLGKRLIGNDNTPV